MVLRCVCIQEWMSIKKPGCSLSFPSTSGSWWVSSSCSAIIPPLSWSWWEWEILLAILFLLSYAKLLKTIVTALSFTDIMMASANNVSDLLTPQRVWVYDGSIEYGNSKHLPLLMLSILFLLLLFFPYTFLLIFGQCLRSLPHKKGFL